MLASTSSSSVLTSFGAFATPASRPARALSSACEVDRLTYLQLLKNRQVLEKIFGKSGLIICRNSAEDTHPEAFE